MRMASGSFLDDVGGGDGASPLTDLARPSPSGTGLSGGQRWLKKNMFNQSM